MNNYYMKKMKWVAFFVIYMAGIQVYAQTTITGRVTNQLDSSPLAGVTIQVKGRVIGTSSGGDGTFSLTVQSQPPMTLVVSSIGFESQEIPVTQTVESLSISLREKSIMGDAVVVSASRDRKSTRL